MKKRIITVISIFILLSFGKCFAQSQFSPILTKMEKSLFGMDYTTQDDAARLKRLEESVYGKVSSSSMSQRVDKLSKDLSADVIGQEIKPKADTFAEDENANQEAVEKADSSVNYPIVDKMEQDVFKQDFRKTEINQRVSNLEQRIFKKTFDDDLNARVDRLRAAIIPERQQLASDSDPSSDEDYNMSDDDILSRNMPRRDILSQNPGGFASPIGPDYNSQSSVRDDYDSSPDVTIPLASLEKSILKKSYPNDLTPNRLTRLEVKMFGSSFVDDDAQTRVDRIASAHQAKKSSNRYDNNKFAQHAATAMQVGAMLLMVLAAIL